MFLRYFIISCFLFCIVINKASAQFMQDMTGRQFYTSPYGYYEGSPFLYKTWKTAIFQTAEGNTFIQAKANIDIYKGIPVYAEAGSIYTFKENINKITFANDGNDTVVFVKGSTLDPKLGNVYVEVISVKPVFLKEYRKRLIEVPGYGSAEKVSRFDDDKVYYINNETGIQKIGLNKSSAKNVFEKKWSGISRFIKENNISLKNQEGWLMLISFAYGNTN